MWNAISLVTSGITLAAFVVAVGAWIYRASLAQRENILKTAPEADRARLVESALEFFNVDTSGLTRHQKFDLAMEQVHSRERRFNAIGRVVSLIAVLLVLLCYKLRVLNDLAG